MLEDEAFLNVKGDLKLGIVTLFRVAKFSKRVAKFNKKNCLIMWQKVKN
jgi:hypothetical protein